MKVKKILLTLAIICLISFNLEAQTPSLPNGNFENWTTFISEIPKNYVWSSNTDAYRSGHQPYVQKTSDAQHGNYAVKMTTNVSNGDTIPGIFVNITPKDDNPAFWRGGFAYDQKATGIHGYYKSDIAYPDTGFVIAFFYKAGQNIGQYGFHFYGKHTEYTPFSFDFLPALSVAPDTIIFGAGSSNYSDRRNIRNGSMLQLDNLTFTGVNSQPVLFNGDFETWETTTIDKPNNWFFSGGSNNDYTGGAYKTSDAKAGNSAIKLITYLDDRQNHSVAQGGRISTGWYPDNCNGNCYEQGGFPFTKKVDTLAFWYKYIPVGNTEADVQVTFKKNGNNIRNIGTNPAPSSTYKYVEIPFSLDEFPDSVILDIQSSQWQDSTVSFVGTTLTIDEIHFKSQKLTTGLNELTNIDAFVIFPNPTHNMINIPILFQGETYEIYNVNRKLIEFGYCDSNQIDLTKIESGFYFLEISTKEKQHSYKFIKD